MGLSVWHYRFGDEYRLKTWNPDEIVYGRFTSAPTSNKYLDRNDWRKSGVRKKIWRRLDDPRLVWDVEVAEGAMSTRAGNVIV